MNATPAIERFQRRLETLTRKWWFYGALLLAFFVPIYAAEAFDPRNTAAVVAQALQHPLAYRLAWMFPLAKLAPVILVLGLAVRPERFRKVFTLYVALLYLVLGVLQNTAVTTQYGLVIIIGNVILIVLVSAFWFWELVAGQNAFVPQHPPLWRWWVAPLALFAFWFPVNERLGPGFTLHALWANEAGLTYCMMTPLILAVLLLFYPSVNKAVMRVSAYVGMLLGLINMVNWFGLMPEAWWIGVTHIPLLAISTAAWVRALRRQAPPEPSPEP